MSIPLLVSEGRWCCYHCEFCCLPVDSYHIFSLMGISKSKVDNCETNGLPVQANPNSGNKSSLGPEWMLALSTCSSTFCKPPYCSAISSEKMFFLLIYFSLYCILRLQNLSDIYCWYFRLPDDFLEVMAFKS